MWIRPRTFFRRLQSLVRCLVVVVACFDIILLVQSVRRTCLCYSSLRVVKQIRPRGCQANPASWLSGCQEHDRCLRTAPISGAAWHHLITRSQTRVQTAPSHNYSDRLHRGHQPLREERVGKAVPGLAHRVWRRVASSAERVQPHRSSALDGAAAALTVARTRGVAMPLSWSWSHQPQGRA